MHRKVNTRIEQNLYSWISANRPLRNRGHSSNYPFQNISRFNFVISYDAKYMYFFLPPIFTILDSHSSRSAFKAAEAPSSLLSLGIFDSGMILDWIQFQTVTARADRLMFFSSNWIERANRKQHRLGSHGIPRSQLQCHSGPIECKGSRSTARRCGFQREWFTQVAYKNNNLMRRIPVFC